MITGIVSARFSNARFESIHEEKCGNGFIDGSFQAPDLFHLVKCGSRDVVNLYAISAPPVRMQAGVVGVFGLGIFE